MSLRKDIEKLTKLSETDNIEAKFHPVNGLGRAEQDLKMNDRPVRLRNGGIQSHLEESFATAEYEEFEYNENYMDEIRKSLRNVIGPELSNARLEDHIRKRQEEAAKRLKNTPTSSSQSTSSSSTLSTLSSSASASVSYKKLENEPEEKGNCGSEDLQNKKLYRNGVFRGLLSKNIISMADLKINEEENTVSKKENTSSEENAQADFRPRVDLVEHPEDPDLYMHPLQAYGKLDYTHDFVLDRIGTKKTMTPRQYYMSLSDSDFEFVKKK